MENFRRQWNLDRTTVTKTLKCLKTSGCKKWRNWFKIRKKSIYKSKLSKSIKGSLWGNQLHLSFRIKKWKPCHGTSNSRPHNVRETLESTFYFTKTVNNLRVKQGRVFQTVRFISYFFLTLYIQFWQYFYSMVLQGVGRDYCQKIGFLEFLNQIFLAWLPHDI